MAKRAAHQHRIELMELGELVSRKDPTNVKKHDLELLGESIDEHGFVDLPAIDENSGLIARGHGRADELAEMFEGKKAPPPEIQVRDGKWYVPVVRGLRFKNRRQLTKYQLADNRIAEKGGWDPGLAKALSALGPDNLVGTGFDAGDLVQFAKGNQRGDDTRETYAVIVDCRSERQQAQLLKRFASMGLKARALAS